MLTWVLTEVGPSVGGGLAVVAAGIVVGVVSAFRRLPLAVSLLPLVLAEGLRAWGHATIGHAAVAPVEAAPAGLAWAIRDVVAERLAAVDALAFTSAAVGSAAVLAGLLVRGREGPFRSPLDRRLALGASGALVVAAGVGGVTTGAWVAWCSAAVVALGAARLPVTFGSWIVAALPVGATALALGALEGASDADPTLLTRPALPTWLLADGRAVGVALAAAWLVPGLLLLLEPDDAPADLEELPGHGLRWWRREGIALVVLGIAWVVGMGVTGATSVRLVRAAAAHRVEDVARRDAADPLLATIDAGDRQRAVVDVVSTPGGFVVDERVVVSTMSRDGVDPFTPLAAHVAGVAAALLGPGTDGDVTVGLWVDEDLPWSTLTPALRALAHARGREVRFVGRTSQGSHLGVPLRLLGVTDPTLARATPLVDGPRLRAVPPSPTGVPDAVLRFQRSGWWLDARAGARAGATVDGAAGALRREVGEGAVRLAVPDDVAVGDVVALLSALAREGASGPVPEVVLDPAAGAEPVP